MASIDLANTLPQTRQCRPAPVKEVWNPNGGVMK